MDTLQPWVVLSFCAIIFFIGFAGIALVLSDRLTLAGVGPLALSVNLLALAGITAGTLYQKQHGGAADLRTGSLIQFAASFVVLLGVPAAGVLLKASAAGPAANCALAPVMTALKVSVPSARPSLSAATVNCTCVTPAGTVTS